MAARWHELEICDSTNDELARLADAGAEHGTGVIARRQRRGRGRRGRVWESASEGNLYASILLRPNITAAKAPAIALLAGICVSVALLRTRRLTTKLKWPNDIVVGDRKLGGILAEASSRSGRLDYIIIGIGLNIAECPPAVADIATSLSELEVESIAPQVLMADIATELESRLERFEQLGVESIRSDYLGLWRDRDRRVRSVSDGWTGIARDLAESGALVVELDSGERVEVVAGDVEIV